MDELKRIGEEALKKIQEAADLKELNDARVAYLGKKSPIQAAMKQMRDMSKEERANFGKISNEVKQSIAKKVEAKKAELEALALEAKIESEDIDISLPSRRLPAGSLHPITIVKNDLENLFLGMGYEVAEGPEVETDHYNFELMNLPKGHPARDMQDTFYIDENTLMRTHTSPVQAHVMLDKIANGGAQPIKVICPGKTYRRDDDDATHSHQFAQCEGLVVDKNITMADLKGTLELFVKKMFGEKREIRLR
ncbi:MAG TPA: phenylalanine--tRNA ligase subunit alpha, partial [Erysipelotrichaceae bacterium]|nr:phenylalanine--tRNA ligase subunit alpha [Erysipelotrichaceae bacterium]